ncbi:MAG: hypothetical protein DWB56_12505 [Candidatus Jettenia sp.]|uniref:Uncharacterized protein n=1 Tax=Candidatus Jettenia caeni TaxID=247490 RepID=I3IP82_9BACT|nr:MAG: hypothetical protein EDM77_11430 [Candidatus Jettenia sp. AMX1]MBC6929757.1 hypothetical protein [Candidatus Jettenia sp.]MCE7880674.1 hypothetical protein [Candidatus Jettenia sp. AMX1]MCQ3927418.1 hypothetical protein [Candidatus Jettenia sp.]GAB63527.1 hypothetical protein KSU1_D0218 [Candidatus Jettenia caeni]
MNNPKKLITSGLPYYAGTVFYLLADYGSLNFPLSAVGRIFLKNQRERGGYPPCKIESLSDSNFLTG